jgi:hypothetical protein
MKTAKTNDQSAQEARDAQSSAQPSTSSDPNRSTDPKEQRKRQGGRGTVGDDKGSQGGEDENEHGDQVEYPKKS